MITYARFVIIIIVPSLPSPSDFMKTLLLMEATLKAENEVGGAWLFVKYIV